jgi:hypothetical protein
MTVIRSPLRVVISIVWPTFLPRTSIIYLPELLP